MAAWTARDWDLLGSYIVLAMVVASLIFSASCFFMLRTIVRHVKQFDPKACLEMYKDVIERRKVERK